MIKIIYFFLAIGSYLFISSIITSPSYAQNNGVVVISEDNGRGVVCYAKNHSTEHISCVKVK